MERNIDRKTLSFSKGMTNVPSDLLSDDTELAESNGFIYRDGEMKPVQGAENVFSIPFKLRYVHKSADYKNLIAYNESEKELKCYNFKGEDFGKFDIQTFSMDDVMDVNSVGNTLVIATSDGLHYLLFKGSKYIDIGNNLPRLTVKFKFEKVSASPNFSISEKDRTTANLQEIVDFKTSSKKLWYDSNGDFITLSEDKPDNAVNEGDDYVYFDKPVTAEKENLFQEAIQGQVAEGINWVKAHNLFAFPFFVRAALKLYDGSYARITNPIICYPCISKNRCVASGYNYNNESEKYISIGKPTQPNYFFYDIQYRQMYYYISLNDSSGNWSDIVKEVVVFASEQVLSFSIDGAWRTISPDISKGIGFHNELIDGEYNEYAFKFKNKSLGGKIDSGITARICIIPDSDNEKSDSAIINELLTKTQFYKLFSINLSDGLTESWRPTIYEKMGDKKVINDNVVSTLTEQEQLKVDDYYGWTKKSFSKLFVYNNRLNAFSCKRYPFDGFAVQHSDVGSSAAIIMIHISSQHMDSWVFSTIFASEDVLTGWFYYPDPNAKNAIIVYNDKVIDLTLKQHPLLNGAYSFENLPSGTKRYSERDYNEEEITSLPIDGFEYLDSQIFTSVVNNPFVFEASGDNTVGTGKILGIVANTETVSQGQFGQYPLLVFTDEGIYAMGVNSEGLYSNVYPISREVCNNADSITPTDNLVFFTSDKGLMAISGGNAACLSEQMRGRVPRNFATMGGGRFLDFLKDCFIAYDYRDSLLRMYKKTKGLDENYDLIDEEDSYYYIYNMVDKTFSMGKLVEKNQHGEFPFGIQAVANDYPDNLVQSVYGGIYSLTNKPDINDDETSYSGGFTTRPLKLGGSMTLKSIRAIKHLHDTDEGKVKLEVYGSNDCKNWVKLDSLGGKPWKYFTFKYTLTDFKACDSFAGSIVEIQGRREDKIR